VDGVGDVRAAGAHGDAWLLEVAVPGDVSGLIVPHGSITVDGVSLTVNEILAPDVMQLSIIDYTMRHTTLGSLRPGDGVHVEGDVIGKYVRRLTAPYLTLTR
jgi:riboflavin synthase